MKKIILIFTVVLISAATQANALLIERDNTRFTRNPQSLNFNTPELATENFTGFGWNNSSDWTQTYDLNLFNSHFNRRLRCARWWGEVGNGDNGGGGENNSPVPEPATLLLFGIGLLGLAGVSRRKAER